MELSPLFPFCSFPHNPFLETGFDGTKEKGKKVTVQSYVDVGPQEVVDVGEINMSAWRRLCSKELDPARKTSPCPLRWSRSPGREADSGGGQVADGKSKKKEGSQREEEFLDVPQEVSSWVR